ncbi:hypothetical protein [Desulforamulus aquiferis]|uniref:YggT family protein n=1 Tax=Desulforamulus aquiferis TaxID=1397668 RepID=A0AAW7ZHA7_9FIRM|nr:hypothetical protein [Desulforamulus aquiferis]MDO7788806.1 hypothetical protein [Desulforamulus aquiferis]
MLRHLTQTLLVTWILMILNAFIFWPQPLLIFRAIFFVLHKKLTSDASITWRFIGTFGLADIYSILLILLPIISALLIAIQLLRRKENRCNTVM